MDQVLWVVCILLCILALSALWVLLLSLFGARWACHPKRHTTEDCLSYDTGKGFYRRDYAEQLLQSAETFQIPSPLGYSLHAMRFLRGREPEGKAVILVHGFGCNLYSSIRYVRLFHDLGFDCLVYDHRYHGESGGAFCTLGGLETEDLLAVARFTRDLYPEGARIGLHGESMGAATAMNVLDRGFPFAFCVEDCGYRSAAEQARYLVRRYTLLFRRPVLHLMLYWIKRKTGVDFETVSPLQAVSGEAAASIPVLFIHGEADRFVPYENLDLLYRAKQGPKALYSVPGAQHAEALRTDPVKYEETVRAFLTENGILP